MCAALPDNVSRRLSALLNLAAGAAGTPEGDNAQAKAEAYAAKHAVNLASYKPTDPDAAQAPKGTTYSPGTARGAQWREVLANLVCSFAGCSMVMHKGRGVVNVWTIIGAPSDVATWRALYERAAADIDAEAARYIATVGVVNQEPYVCGAARTDVSGLSGWCRWQGQTAKVGYDAAAGKVTKACPQCGSPVARRVAPPVSRKSEGDTFRKGAAMGFGARLREHKAEAEASVNGRVTADALRSAGVAEPQYALVLTGRTLAVKKEQDRLFPKLKKGAGVRMGGGRGAREAGYDYGRGLGVHKGEIG